MALFKIFRGEREALETLKVTDGYAYFVPKDGKFYIDISENDGVEPIFGSSTKDGANRVCINEGSVNFDNLLILNCGDAEAEGNIQIIEFNGGNSSSKITENTLILSGGNSTSQISSETIIYRCKI